MPGKEDTAGRGLVVEAGSRPAIFGGTMGIRVADWVEFKEKKPDQIGPIGIVKRISVMHGWADVEWPEVLKKFYKKRIPVERLRVLHSIPLPGGMTVTDVSRKEELDAETRTGRGGPAAG